MAVKRSKSKKKGADAASPLLEPQTQAAENAASCDTTPDQPQCAPTAAAPADPAPECSVKPKSSSRKAVHSKPACSAKTEQPASEAAPASPSGDARIEQPPFEAIDSELAATAQLEQPAEQPAGRAPNEPPLEDRKISKQHHVSSILDAVLSEEIPQEYIDAAGKGERFHYPMYADALLALGLLIAVAGFSIGLVKMYVTHEAQQHIMQGDYRTAIALLENTPLPPVFSVDSSNPDEALSQALYLDALNNFQFGRNTAAWADLQQIRAGSRYFDQSQRLLSENFVPSGTVLQCTVSNKEISQAPDQ